MDKIIPGLFLAAVSALGFLAYRHQAIYAALFPFLSFGLPAIAVGVAIWNVAVDFTHAKLISLLKGSLAGDDIVRSIKAPLYWIIALWLAWVYVLFLAILPAVLAS